MKLSEFLIHVLTAHSQTLIRLAALLGEDELLVVLELAGENENKPASSAQIDPRWFREIKIAGDTSGYMQLESAVRGLKLSSVLQFHLWAYPYYRVLIESSLTLNSEIQSFNDSEEALVDQAMVEAKKWVRRLPLPSELSIQAEKISTVPWVRFRAEVLKGTGLRPLQLR